LNRQTIAVPGFSVSPIGFKVVPEMRTVKNGSALFPFLSIKIRLYPGHTIATEPANPYLNIIMGIPVLLEQVN
jgi:hypothetical protein